MPAMQYCHLINIQSLDDIYQALEENLNLPCYFRHNLDAMYDSLSADVTGQITLTWFDHKDSIQYLGQALHDAVFAIFCQLAAEREGFSFSPTKENS